MGPLTLSYLNTDAHLGASRWGWNGDAQDTGGIVGPDWFTVGARRHPHAMTGRRVPAMQAAMQHVQMPCDSDALCGCGDAVAGPLQDRLAAKHHRPDALVPGLVRGPPRHAWLPPAGLHPCAFPHGLRTAPGPTGTCVRTGWPACALTGGLMLMPERVLRRAPAACSRKEGVHSLLLRRRAGGPHGRPPGSSGRRPPTCACCAPAEAGSCAARAHRAARD